MPITGGTYAVPNNFVQQYDLGQKKIRADLVDANFTDLATVINDLLDDDENTVHKTGDETIAGNKTFTGTTTLADAVITNLTASGDITLSGTVSATSFTLTDPISLPSGSTAVTPSANDNSTKIATTAWVNANCYGFKTGDFVFSYLGSKAGFLLCNGATVSRTTYAGLFSVIGTKFGAGDGSTTFKIPDFRGRFAQGANGNLGSVINAGLPNATGALPAYAAGPIWNGAGSGALYNNYSAAGYNGYQYSGSVTRSSDTNVRLSLQKSNSIYGNSSTVQPPAITLNVFIKY